MGEEMSENVIISRLQEAGKFAFEHGFFIEVGEKFIVVRKTVLDNGKRVGFQQAVSYLDFEMAHINVLIKAMEFMQREFKEIGL